MANEFIPSTQNFGRNFDQNFGEIVRYKNCNKPYKYIRNLQRHMKYECGVAPMFQCTLCNYQCHQKGNLKLHYAKKHNKFDVNLN